MRKRWWSKTPMPAVVWTMVTLTDDGEGLGAGVGGLAGAALGAGGAGGLAGAFTGAGGWARMGCVSTVGVGEGGGGKAGATAGLAATLARGGAAGGRLPRIWASWVTGSAWKKVVIGDPAGALAGALMP